MSNEVRAAYDTMAKRYAALDHRIDRIPTDREWLDAFAEMARDRRGPVADLGCGTGHVVQHLSELGLAACGYDISRAQIAEAQRGFPDAQFAVGDLASLDVADESLGGVVSRYSLIHVVPSRLARIFDDWHRVLEPGAPVLIQHFAAASAPRHGTPFDHAVVTAYELYPATIEEQLDHAGFGDIKVGRRAPLASERQLDHATLLGRKLGG